MKKWYVYELYNLLGTVEYVGESSYLDKRFKEHTKSKRGKFYNRTDISMNVVKTFDNRRDAYYYQIELQKQYSLETDIEKIGKYIKGKPKSAEQKRKMSEAKLGKAISDTHKENIIKANKARTGIPLSAEHKRKISEAGIRRYYTTNT